MQSNETESRDPKECPTNTKQSDKTSQSSQFLQNNPQYFSKIPFWSIFFTEKSCTQ